MKKITMIAAVAVLALSFASCKKDRTCNCTSTSTEPGYTSTPDVTVYMKSKKHDARVYCVSAKYDYDYYNGTAMAKATMTTTCELK